MNPEKTKYLCVGGTAEDLELENKEIIKSYEDYKDLQNLGTKITREGKDAYQIRERLALAGKAIKTLNRIWWHRDISKRTKYNIHNAIVKSNMTYGSEVCSLTEPDKRKIMATQKLMLSEDRFEPVEETDL